MVFKAIKFVAEAHQGQYRKGTNIPYIAHLMNVMKILCENGCDKEIVTAGILHDVVEDTGTKITEIENRFGKEVAGYVAEVTDDKTFSKLEIKKAQIERVRAASLGARMIKVADKIHNCYSLLSAPKEWDRVRVQGYACWSLAVVNAAFSNMSMKETAQYSHLLEMFYMIGSLPYYDDYLKARILILPATDRERTEMLKMFYLSLEK